ncbi:MAG: cytochrome c oxidase assembly protein [Rhizobiaceae bacterium]|nr:cytochrome c oxidase assembly protein [Rhizobiaceae bacterium]
MGESTNARRRMSNGTVALACGAFIVGMVGVSYAAVPLYQLFCQVTGYGGTTQRVEQFSDTVLDRTITVRFDANTANGLPWEFGPKQRDVTMKIGETVQVAYAAKNIFGKPTSGRSSFNVTPQSAGSYFMKVECFCFTDTELAPGEEMEMPVVFFVDPAIVDAPEFKNINTLTLSYTFYPIDSSSSEAKESVSLPKAGANLGG